MSADLCRRQSRLTGWPLWWRSDSGRVSPPSAPLFLQYPDTSTSSMFHLWKRFAKKNLNLFRVDTRANRTRNTSSRSTTVQYNEFYIIITTTRRTRRTRRTYCMPT